MMACHCQRIWTPSRPGRDSIPTPSGRASGSLDDKIDALFAGPKAHWCGFADSLIEELRASGQELTLAPTNAYLSLVSQERKFAILQSTAKRLDVGIKRKGVSPMTRRPTPNFSSGCARPTPAPDPRWRQRTGRAAIA